MKKEWTKPKLVVLFRARSDESVLGYCKTIANQTGPLSGFEACNIEKVDDVCPPITYCEIDVTS